MEKKPVELLDRLKTVKVTSDDVQGEKQETSRPLPQERYVSELPLYGYEEPKSISEGKCTLRQALQFITNHQNNPSNHSIAAIAEEYKMKTSDVENIIDNFKAYEIYVASDKNIPVTKNALKALGISRVNQPLFKPKFASENAKRGASKSEEKK